MERTRWNGHQRQLWRCQWLYNALALMILSASHATGACDAPLRFPADAVVDVTKAPYFARGDGLSDDTAALRQAIAAHVGRQFAHSTLYFPPGTYLVQDRLAWQSAPGAWKTFLTLQGAGVGCTTIKLRDQAPGYQNPSSPKAVIFTASFLHPSQSPTAGGKNWTLLGEGNEAFQNNLFDLTIHTGSGNPGAIGVDFLANNQGTLTRLEVVSGDGRGVAGVSMKRNWSGPLLVESVTVRGFEIGIDIARWMVGVTLHNVTVEGQRVAGLRNVDQQVALEAFTSRNSVPAIQNQGNSGLLTLVNAVMTGGAASASAIETIALIHAQHVSASGYRSVFRTAGSVVPGLVHDHYVARPVPSLFPSPSVGLALPESNPVPVHTNDLTQWANVQDYSAVPGISNTGDDGPAMQAAIDAGKHTVYFPPGVYRVRAPVFVRGNVRRILGMFAVIVPHAAYDGQGPLFMVRETRSTPVAIERLTISQNHWDLPRPAFHHLVEQTGRQPLVLRHILGHSYQGYAGEVHMADVCCGRVVTQGQRLTAHQLNIEVGDAEPKLINRGSTVRVLGYKTERPTTVLETSNGGKTEILGGMFYPVWEVPAGVPLIVNREGAQSLSYVERSPIMGRLYQIQIEETRGGETRRLLAPQTVRLSGGTARGVPLFTGYPAP